MYKMVVFDLDGTLCDTLMDLANSVNLALKEYDLRTYDVEQYRQFVGNGIDNLIRTVLADKSDDDILFCKVKEGFQRNYALHLLDYTKDYPGMRELLLKLEKDGIIFGMISNKPDVFVGTIMEKVYPGIGFTFLIGKKDEFRRKPDPQSLLHYIDIYKCKRDEVLYVGDSNVDVKYAHNADVKVCGVTWGFRGRFELENEGADYIAEDTNELQRVIYGEKDGK